MKIIKKGNFISIIGEKGTVIVGGISGEKLIEKKLLNFKSLLLLLKISFV